MNSKIKDAISVFLIQLVLTLPLLSASAYGLSISDVKVTKIAKDSATVEWKTDVPADSKVTYGKTKSLGLIERKDAMAKEHSVLLASGILPSTEYFFMVESKDSSGNAATDDNSKALYSFKTISAPPAETSGPTANPAQTGPPPIDVSIPQFFNKNSIDISGSTRPFSSVTLFVNDMNVPRRNLNANEIGESGKFAFLQVQLEQQNRIKIAVEDKAGNKNEQDFDVEVDTESPLTKLNEIKSVTSKPEITLSGNVNKPVTIKVYLDSESETQQDSIPAKVTGLKLAKAGQNSIELKWDESKEKDFSHYIVYRDDVGPIATTNPASYNNYPDTLVDSGQEYKYEVSAADMSGNEGPKSDSLLVKTLTGGKTLNLKPNPVDIFKDSSTPISTIEANGDFNFAVKLSKGDGTYNLRLVFEDRAGNKFTSGKTITLDTKKPAVKITSPQAGAMVYENYANEVNIIGKTKPNSRVHLFVDRTPLGAFDTSIQVTGIPNEAQNVQKSDVNVAADFASKIDQIKETELESKCKSIIASRAVCKEGADRSITADSDGNFRFGKVDLTAAFALATRLTEVSPSDFRDVKLNPEAKDTKKANILVISTDQLGQRGFAQQTINIGTCWSGNQSWDIIPLTYKQSPAFLSTERMAEGTEALYFYFNYTYIGRGASARIDGISLSKACSTREVSNPRFNLSCRVLPAGDSPTKLNPDGTLTYSVVPLIRYEGMEKFLKGDWKSFFEALGVNRDMTFPFKVTIRYKHDVVDDTGVSRTMTETQTACQEVSYVIDNTLIDPRKVMPDFLLYDFVDFMQKSINTLTKVQEQIDRVVDYVAIGCLYSFFAHLIFKIYRNIVDISTEKTYLLKKAFTSGSQEDEDCKKIAEAVKKAHGSFQLKYVSDPDLKKCWPSSYSAWKREAGIYEWQRWSCDRIFGHTSPSRWTETKKDDDIQKKLSTPTTCENDGIERGQPIQMVDCYKIEGKWNNNAVKLNYFGSQPIGQKCFEIKARKSDPNALYVYTLYKEHQESRLLANNIYKLEPYEGRPRTDEIVYAQKLPGSDTQFITRQLQTCDELCGGDPNKPGEVKVSVGGKEYIRRTGGKYDPKKPAPPTPQDPTKPQDVAFNACVPVSDCRAWYANARETSLPENLGAKKTQQSKNLIQFGDEAFNVNSVENKGYGFDCFYDAVTPDGRGKWTNPDVVSPKNSQTRQVCCCVNGKSSASQDIYYQPDDIDKELESELANVQLSTPHQQYIHESKSVPGSPPKTDIPDPDTEKNQGFSDMKWSYRYWRIGYLNKKYNPNRYTEGRDLPACFGQNNLLYKLKPGGEKETVTLNPFKESTAALQCAYLTGISQRLQMYKNIMSAMSSCLITVRESGRADAGVCKELFTQHVCGLIWQAVKFFTDGCTPEDPGVNVDAQESGIVDKLKTGFKGISQGVTEAQLEFSEEYQNAKLNNLLGIGEGGVARKVCLGAFGYDWSLTSKNLIDAAYAAPFATLVLPVTKSREFMTIDPLTIRPTYEYRASWIINPGCDLDNYRAELVCVTRKELDEYPNNVNCGAVGSSSIKSTAAQGASSVGIDTGTFGTSTGYNSCDCLDASLAPAPFTIFTGNQLKQNMIKEEDFHRVIPTQYRYDHLKFTLRPDRKIPANMQKNCFPTGYEKGVFYFPITDKTARDIEDCSVDPLSGSFRCGAGTDFFSSRGIAQILEVSINDENPEKAQNRQMLEFQIGKPLSVGARVSKTGKDKCMRITLSPDIVSPAFVGITAEGTSNIPPQTIVDQLTVAGRSGNILAPGITFKPRLQNNQDPVFIQLSATDNKIPKEGYVATDNPVGRFTLDDALIIDGHEIDLVASRVDPKGNAETKITIEGNSKDNLVIVVEKFGAALEITGISYQSPLRPDDPYKLDTQIQVNPAQQGIGTSQPKTIMLEVFGIKPSSDTYNNQEDCNVNEKPLDQKSYQFKVSERGVDTSKLPPSIQTPRVIPLRQAIGRPVEISARVSNRGGAEIPVGGVTITIVDSSSKVIVDKLPMSKIDDAIGYIYTFPTNNLIPGKYAGTIHVSTVKDPECNQCKNTFNFELIKDTQPTGAAATPPTIDSTPKIPVLMTYKLDAPPRPNFADVDTIILHHTGDPTFIGAYTGLKNKKDSSHYVIDTDGTIYYTVDEKLSAQHAGTWNSRSIGIEIVNTGYKTMQFTGAQYDSIKKLMSDISSRWTNIKIDNQHVLAHYEVDPDRKFDPSPNFDWSRIGLPNHKTYASLGKKPDAEYGFG